MTRQRYNLAVLVDQRWDGIWIAGPQHLGKGQGGLGHANLSRKGWEATFRLEKIKLLYIFQKVESLRNLP